MTIRERVDAATVEELPTIAAELAEAEAALRLRLNTATTRHARADDDALLTPKEVAAELRVSPWSAGEMIRRGTLASVATSPGGKLRGVRRSVVEKYKADNERGATMPPRRK